MNGLKLPGVGVSLLTKCSSVQVITHNNGQLSFCNMLKAFLQLRYSRRYRSSSPDFLNKIRPTATRYNMEMLDQNLNIILNIISTACVWAPVFLPEADKFIFSFNIWVLTYKLWMEPSSGEIWKNKSLRMQQSELCIGERVLGLIFSIHCNDKSVKSVLFFPIDLVAPQQNMTVTVKAIKKCSVFPLLL